MNKYNVGDTVRIRRYKDLCCEFPVNDGNIVNDGHISRAQMSICGRIATVKSVTEWHEGHDRPIDSGYYLNGLEGLGYRYWVYKECYLESEVL